MATIPDATGDPFPAPAWTHNAWPTLQGYLLLYVGEDTLLAWSPADSKYELWKFTRTPPIGQTPLVQKIWSGILPGISVGHELIYLGGNRLLSWRLSDSRYRVWLIDRNPPPGVDPLGNGVPQTNGVWSTVGTSHTIMSLGGDRVLVWEPTSGKFRIFRHDPAALGAADPLPGPPVAQGQWANRVGRDLVYLGGDRVLDRDRVTGDFQVLVYDRAATGDPFAGDPHIAKGQWTTIRIGHQLVYLDGDRVLDFVKGDGSYNLWIYERAVTTLRKAIIRLHIRRLVDVPDLDGKLKQTKALFASYGFDVEIASNIALTDADGSDFGAFKTVMVGECKRSEPVTEALTQLHALLRKGKTYAKTDIFVVFVRGMSYKFTGCAKHPIDNPGTVVDARQATEWTIAHEVGHILGLDHVAETNQVMIGAHTGGVAYPPPDFTGDEIAKMLTSPYIVIP